MAVVPASDAAMEKYQSRDRIERGPAIECSKRFRVLQFCIEERLFRFAEKLRRGELHIREIVTFSEQEPVTEERIAEYELSTLESIRRSQEALHANVEGSTTTCLKSPKKITPSCPGSGASSQSPRVEFEPQSARLLRFCCLNSSLTFTTLIRKQRGGASRECAHGHRYKYKRAGALEKKKWE